MPVQLTIRNVPEALRDEIAQRAARRHQSMQEFLLTEIERMALKPSVEDWLERVRHRKPTSRQTPITTEEILRHRDSDRL